MPIVLRLKKPLNPLANMPTVHPCAFCSNSYVETCDGKDPWCLSAYWRRQINAGIQPTMPGPDWFRRHNDSMK